MDKEKQKLLTGFVYPLALVCVLWLVKTAEIFGHWELQYLGIYPLRLKGLQGIFFAPLLHSGFPHLISNSIPLLILGWALYYFYGRLAIRITILAWVITGFWVWVFAREAYHIGASGLVYSWATFLFVSGIIRHHPRLMAISLLVAFLYGSMVWGIFPLQEGISWEGHLMGMLAGIVLAMFFREEGPQRKPYSWEEEVEEEEEDDPIPYWQQAESTSTASEDPKEAP